MGRLLMNTMYRFGSIIAYLVLLRIVTHEKSNDCNEKANDSSYKSDHVTYG